MADFSALKQSIQNYIKQNGNKEITGNLLQTILLSMVTTMGDGAINDNASDISDIQNEIQNITGALYAGYATPSTMPATLTSQEVFYLATQAGTYTNFHFNGGDDPIVLTKDGIYFIVSGNDDDDWNAEPMLQLDDVPTASSNNAVKSGGVAEELALGAVYDVSAKNPTAGPNNDGKWESLSALFSDANLSTLIPASVRKGGMSIKFVQSSDNKYVQYRLMADSWSIDTDDWSFCGDSVYVENTEWIYVLLDSEKRILAGLKSDGSVEWSIGVPTPVKTYIANTIAEIKNGTEGTDLDGLNKIIAFLSDFSTSDTLKDLLDTKVDKEEGKGLIPTQYIQEIESPEFIEVTLDAEERILEAVMVDGTKLLPAGVKINEKIDFDGNETTIIESPEFIETLTDKEGKVIEGIKTDGTKEIRIPVRIKNALKVDGEIEINELKINELNIDENKLKSEILNEYVDVTTDKNKAVVFGIFENGKVVFWNDIKVRGLINGVNIEEVASDAKQNNEISDYLSYKNEEGEDILKINPNSVFVEHLLLRGTSGKVYELFIDDMSDYPYTKIVEI